MKAQTFIFIGRSGCGKGTQAELLKTYLTEKSPEVSTYHLELGAKFREFISGPGEVSDLSRKMYVRGDLQPEFLAVWGWTEALIENFSVEKHLVIDGTPRKLHEAQVLDGALKFLGREKPHFIYLNVGRKWAEERLLGRGRSDDDIKNITIRLDWFDRDVVPAVEFFKNKPEQYHFLEVNGEQTVSEVWKEIETKLQIS